MSRFVQRDSWKGELKEPISLNRYVYCYNDPVNYVDISGNRRLESMDADRHGVMHRPNKRVDTSGHSDSARAQQQAQEQARREQERQAALARKTGGGSGSNSSGGGSSSYNKVKNPYAIGPEYVTEEELVCLGKLIKEDEDENKKLMELLNGKNKELSDTELMMVLAYINDEYRTEGNIFNEDLYVDIIDSSVSVKTYSNGEMSDILNREIIDKNEQYDNGEARFKNVMGVFATINLGVPGAILTFVSIISPDYFIDLSPDIPIIESFDDASYDGTYVEGNVSIIVKLDDGEMIGDMEYDFRFKTEQGNADPELTNYFDFYGIFNDIYSKRENGTDYPK